MKPQSKVAQVHEVLESMQREQPGRVISMHDLLEHLPGMERNHISAALGLLSQPRYAGLERLPKEGRVRHYKLLDAIFSVPIDHRGTPAEHKKSRDGAPDRKGLGMSVSFREPQPNEDEPSSTPDVILSGCMEYEEGNLEQAMTYLRDAYLRIKREQKLSAMQEKMTTR